MEVPSIIRCMECGGEAHLLTRFAPDEPARSGDLLSYRCADCQERWDVVYEEEDDEAPTATGRWL